MSREEAIKVLNMVEAHGLADEAKQIAIKALQAQADCNTCDKAVRDRVGVIGCAKFDSKPTMAIPSAEPCEDAISREELLKAIDTWDKFGYDAKGKLVQYQDHYIPYIHYDDVVKCIKGMPSVKPQEPCYDAISRQALLKLMGEEPFNWTDSDKELQEVEDYRNFRNMVEQLPSVNPQEPKWILVSEKLPKPFTFVNATCRSLVDDRENWVVETVYVPIPKEVNKHGYSDWGNIPMLNWGEAEVVAWVERIIPQPYKAEVEPQESEDKE